MKTHSLSSYNIASIVGRTQQIEKRFAHCLSLALLINRQILPLSFSRRCVFLASKLVICCQPKRIKIAATKARKNQLENITKQCNVHKIKEKQKQKFKYNAIIIVVGFFCPKYPIGTPKATFNSMVVSSFVSLSYSLV